MQRVQYYAEIKLDSLHLMFDYSIWIVLLNEVISRVKKW